MGGFSFGDMASLGFNVSLDNSTFIKAVRESQDAVRLLNIDVGKMAGSVGGFVDEMTKAGVSSQALNKYLTTLEGTGKDVSEVFKYIAAQVQIFQDNVNSFREEKAYGEMYKRAGEEAREWGKYDKLVTDQARTNVKTVEDAWAEYEKERQQDMKASEKVAKETLAQELKAHKETIDQKKKDSQEFYDLQKKQADLAYDQQRQQATRARQQEHEQYFQFRQASAVASAGTQIGVGLTAAGAVPLAALMEASKSAAEFEDSMNRVRANIGDVSADLKERLAKSAREAAKETGLAAKEIGDAFYQMKSGGMSAEEIITNIKNIAEFAVAGNGNLEKSTKTLLGVRNALGDSTISLVDIENKLIRADQLSVGTAEEFAKALEGKASGSIKVYSRSLDEALAMVMAFTKSGLSAAEANTAYTRTWTDLTMSAQKHGDVMIKTTSFEGKWRDVIYDTTGKIRPAVDILKDLNNIMLEMSDEQKVNFLSMINLQKRTSDSIRLIAPLSGTIREFEKELVNAGSTMENVFAARMESPIKKLEVVKARITDLVITLGTPMVDALMAANTAAEPLYKTVENLGQAFSGLSETQKEMVVTSVAMAGALTAVSGTTLIVASNVVRLAADLKMLMGAQGFAELIGILKGGAMGAAGVAGIAAVSIGTGTLIAIGQLEKQLELVNKAAERTKEFAEFMKDVADKAGLGVMAMKQLADFVGKYHKEQAEMGKSTTMSEGDVNDLYKAQIITLEQKRVLLQAIEKVSQDANKAEGERIKNELQQANSMIGKISLVDPKAASKESPEVFDPKKVAKDRKALFQAAGLHDYETEIAAAVDAVNKLWDQLSESQRGKALDHLAKMEYEYQKSLDPTVFMKYTEARKFFNDEALRTSDIMLKLHDTYQDEVKGQQELDKNRRDLRKEAKELDEMWKAYNLLVEAEQSEGEYKKYVMDQLEKLNPARVLEASILRDGNKLLENQKAVTDGVIVSEKELTNEYKNQSKELENLGVVGSQSKKPSRGAVSDFIEEFNKANKGFSKLVSQQELDDRYNYAKAKYEELNKLQAEGFEVTTYEMNQMWVAMIRAQAEATHDGRMLMSREYREIENSIRSTVKTSDSLWKQHLREIGQLYHSFLRDTSRAIVDILFPRSSGTKQDVEAITQLGIATGLTGQKLQDLTKVIEDLAKASGQDFRSIASGAADLFKNFGTAVEEQIPTLRNFFAISQQTKTSVTDLITGVNSNVAIFKALGLSADQAAMFIGKISASGQNANDVLGSLKSAFDNISSKGFVDPAKALADLIQRIKDAGSESEALSLATKYFGNDAQKMIQVIRSGVLDFKNLNLSVDGTTQSIEQAAEKTKELEKEQSILGQLFGEVWRNTLRKAIDIGIDHLVDFISKSKLLHSVWEGLKGIFTAVGQAIGLVGKTAIDAADAALSASKAASQAIDLATGVGSGVAGAAGGAAQAAGGATQAAGGATQAAGQASQTGGALSGLGGVAGTVNMVSGIVGAIGSIGSFIQGIRQEGTSNAIEHNTRYAMIYLGEQSDSVLETLHVIRNLLSDFLAGGAGFNVLVDLNKQMNDRLGVIIEHSGFGTITAMTPPDNTESAPAPTAGMELVPYQPDYKELARMMSMSDTLAPKVLPEVTAPVMQMANVTRAADSMTSYNEGTQYNTFHIVNDDPKMVAEEVSRHLAHKGVRHMRKLR